LSFQALGTRCEVQYAAPGGDVQAQAFERVAVAWVTAFEAKYSRFRPDSLISRINAAAGREWVAVDAEAEALFKLCDTLHFMTQGVLDPTALPLMRLWDYKAATPRIPTAAEIAAARSLVGWKKVRREPGRCFCPSPEWRSIRRLWQRVRGRRGGAVGGGASLAVCAGRLRARPAGDRCAAGPTGLAYRFGRSAGAGAFHGQRGAGQSRHCFFGDYLRGFTVDGRRYGHIIDPRTGWPVANGCVQANVVAATCLQAGVLSTAAFVLGVPSGIDFIQSFPGAEGLLVTQRVRAQTRGFFNYVAS
jgi:thiamine biosynthesis lipoprotein